MDSNTIILALIGIAIVCVSNVIAYNWGKTYGFALGRTTSIRELITDFLPSNSEEKLKVTVERQKNSKQ
jgi:hypothetical protein|nr:MAG TPA: hypothetical protein [Caudoviricetes sp.]DAQ97854.1 MAG TPA: hypothetical protein [Caudoviricetes sp.]